MKFKFFDQFQCIKHFFSKKNLKMNKGALPTSVPSEECLAVYQQLGPLIQARGQSEFSFRNNFTTLFNKGKSVALSLKLVKASRPTNHQTGQ
jgi:hypothetical protein